MAAVEVLRFDTFHLAVFNAIIIMQVRIHMLQSNIVSLNTSIYLVLIVYK